MVNRGKDFEQQFRTQLQQVFDVIRLADNTAGYMGGRNICDFIAYKFPYMYYLELKTTKGNTLPFRNITQNQFEGLIEKEQIEGVGAGIVVWFLEHNATFFVSAGLLKQLRQEGKKSLHIEDLTEKAKNFNEIQYFKCFKIRGIKKRVFFNYDIEKFKENLEVYLNYGK